MGLCPSRMVFSLEDVMACTKRLLEVIAGWLLRHLIGAVLISLPALAVFSHFTSEFETNIYVSLAMLDVVTWQDRGPTAQHPFPTHCLALSLSLPGSSSHASWDLLSRPATSWLPSLHLLQLVSGAPSWTPGSRRGLTEEPGLCGIWTLGLSPCSPAVCLLWGACVIRRLISPGPRWSPVAPPSRLPSHGPWNHSVALLGPPPHHSTTMRPFCPRG